MVSFCHHFIKDFSTIAAPLRYLTKKDVPFQWTKQQQHTFNTLQHTLCSSETLAFYNPNADIRLTVDASPQGLGAILSQSQLDGSYCTVLYGSRLLTDVEIRYSQMERESLAVLWACKHFHYYVYYQNFTIQTDHKRLEQMLSPTSNPPPHIQRWLPHLQPYNYINQCIPGNLNHADYLSRKFASIDNLDSNISVTLIDNFLLQYRTPPHAITNIPPPQLIFCHTPHNDLPSVDSTNKPTKADKQVNKDHPKREDKIGEYADKKRKAKSVTFAVGEKILLRNIHRANKLDTIWENQTYTVLKVYLRSVKL